MIFPPDNGDIVNISLAADTLTIEESLIFVHKENSFFQLLINCFGTTISTVDKLDLIFKISIKMAIYAVLPSPISSAKINPVFS